MSIKDIVNREVINLTNCESEPIHIPGSIQPHGFILALQGADFTIEFCSANTASFIDIEPGTLLGRQLITVLPEDEVQKFEDYIAQFESSSAYPHVFTIGDTSYNTIITKSGAYLLLEFEPFPDGTLNLPNLYSQTRKFIAFIESTNYLRDLCQSVAEETREITGYDRVMIYRFDKEYNGEVFAESKRADLDSFLDHRYPHTDIPVQARNLYVRNLLRIIVDVDYQPVPLLTLQDNADHASLDLSHSILRSVSPIHIEYLKNMGVKATLTVSLMHNGQLWGLIACHHYAAKKLPHYTRLSAQLQGHFLTSQISVREVKEEYDLAQRSEVHLQQLQLLLLDRTDFIRKHYNNPHLLDMPEAGGIAIISEGIIYKNGVVPPDDAIYALISWLHQYAQQGYFNTHHLAAAYPEASGIASVASGIIYHSLGINNDSIIWFRPEVVQTINWAGDPNKAVLKGENGMRLTPRKSFDLWREFVKCQSIPWSKPHIHTAGSFAYALQKYMLFQFLQREEERYRKLSEKLQEANEELANINWISTHDLKEPLRKIQIFGSRILESHKDALSQTVMDTVARMRTAANRMQALLDDILSYSNLSHKEEAFTPVDLNKLLSNTLEDLKEEISSKSGEVSRDVLPTITAIPFQIQQLLHNLISNAVKFAKTDVPLQLSIGVTTADDGKQLYHCISIRDNGIGFDNSYTGKIFDIFQRLHHAKEYGGTGIGLAICRKIMSNHHGYITAHGEEGVGATFNLHFPVN